MIGIKNKPSSLLVIVLLTVILIISFFVRIQSLVDGSFAYTYDVGRDLLVLSEIIETGKPPLIGPTSGLHGLFYGPWWYYMTFVPYMISFGDPRGGLLFMVLTGVLTVFFGYVVGKRISGVFLGVLLAALVAVSPVLTGVSKQIWNPNIAPFLLMLILFVLWYVYKFVIDEQKSKKKLFIESRGFAFLSLGLLLTLSVDAEVVYGGILFLLTVLFCLCYLNRKLKFHDGLYFFLGVILILLPRIVFEIRHDFLMSQTILTFLAGGSGKSFSLSILESLPNRLSILFDLWVRTLAFNNTYVGYFLGVLVGISFLLYRKYTRLERFFIWYSLVGILGYLFFLSIFNQDIWDHYIVGVPILFVLLLSLSIYIIQKQTNKFLIVFFCSLLVGLNLYDTVSHFPKADESGEPAYYRNHLQVVDYIYLKASGEPFNTITYTPPVHDYTYRYLFKWYGEKTYGYQPLKTNVEKFYVIVEPDYELPERRESWLTERSVDGQVLREDILNGEILVQTRIH